MSVESEPVANIPSSTRSGFTCRWMGYFVQVVSVAVAAIYLASVVLGRFWPFELLTHFRLQIAVVMLALAVVLLLSRRGLWKWAFGCFTVPVIWSVIAIQLPMDQPPTGNERLRVMSANILNSNLRASDFEHLVAELDPDVLVILEYTFRWDQQLTSVKAQFPYSVISPRNYGFGIAIFSKRPLRNVEEILLDDSVDVPTLFCEIEVSGQKVGLAAVHTLSPITRSRFASRNKQLHNLARRVATDNRPQIVAGDFNSTTWSPYVADFLRDSRLHDSRAGFGLQTSWPQFNWLMLIPIDHAFVSREFHIHRRWVERDIGSDHYPIVLDISLTLDLPETNNDPGK